MKRSLFIFIFAAFIVGCASNENDFSSEISVPVSVTDVNYGTIEEYVETSGTLMPLQEASLNNEIGGNYLLLKNPRTGKKFAVGDKVNKNEIIVKIYDAEFENEIRIDLKKLSLDNSLKEFEKQKSLYEKGGVTLRELNSAETEYLNLKYSYENALLQLEKFNIRAPFSGVIVDIPYFTENVKITAGAKVLKIMNYSELFMEVNLPEKLLPDVKINQNARIMNYTMDEDTLSGVVTQLSPAIDIQTRTFESTLIIKNEELKLRPGMFAKAEIVLEKKDSTIVIPKDIIVAKQRGKTIFVVSKGAAREVVITTGLENPNQIEVVKGLKLNERIVTKGFETLSNRSKVKIIK